MTQREDPALRVSNPAREGIYQGSKWLKFHVLCNREELEAFFAQIRPFFIFPLGGIVDGHPISEKTFLDAWSECIHGLQNSIVPKIEDLRRILACAWVDNLHSLWLQKVEGKGYLAKICQPVVQVQAHWFSFSEVDRVFRPMSMGPESIFWGLQFSYPQIFQDPVTMELKTVERSMLFEKLRVWVREATRPTPFSIDRILPQLNSSEAESVKEKVCVPIRLGRKCFSWIGKHPQLIARGIGVYA